jgi:hypothetical protein
MQVAAAAARHHDTATALDEAATVLAARLAPQASPGLVLAYGDARHDPEALAEGLGSPRPRRRGAGRQLGRQRGGGPLMADRRGVFGAARRRRGGGAVSHDADRPRLPERLPPSL